MAIAHRSVILDCFGCVGLVLTTIVHRFVCGAYALLLLQRKEGEHNICQVYILVAGFDRMVGFLASSVSLCSADRV